MYICTYIIPIYIIAEQRLGCSIKIVTYIDLYCIVDNDVGVLLQSLNICMYYIVEQRLGCSITTVVNIKNSFPFSFCRL